jgi:predicted LPLAT superfamily acyltransferase
MPRRPEREQEPGAQEGERRRGNQLGIWFFAAFLRVFGLRGAYGLLYVVSCYYVLVDRSLVESALPYIRRRFPGSTPLQERLHALRLFVSQGKQLIDRYAAVSGKGVFQVRLEADQEFVSRIRDPNQGAILLTSHGGNWQVAMTALGELGKAVHLVMVPERNPALERWLQPEGEAGKVRIISPRQYLGGVVEIMNALRNGHVVSMMGDRRYGARAVEVDFLGEKAWFPYSAFSLAAAVGCPLVVLKTIKASTYCYVVDLTKVLYPRCESGRDRVGQLQPWVQRFVDSIESFAGEHPYQCYLVRDVWKEGR